MPLLKKVFQWGREVNPSQVFDRRALAMGLSRT